MNLDAIRSQLGMLSELVAGWDASRAIPSLERDLALEKLRAIYDALRFGSEPAASAEAGTETAGQIDLGDILSLDADFAPDRISAAGDTAAPAAASADDVPQAVAEVSVAARPVAETLAGEGPVCAGNPVEEEPAAAQSAKPAQKQVTHTLFGPEDEFVRHRHKQRVILSLYGGSTSASPARPASGADTASGPARPGESVPTQPAAASAPVVRPEAETVSDRSGKAAAVGQPADMPVAESVPTAESAPVVRTAAEAVSDCCGKAAVVGQPADMPAVESVPTAESAPVVRTEAEVVSDRSGKAASVEPDASDTPFAGGADEEAGGVVAARTCRPDAEISAEADPSAEELPDDASAVRSPQIVAVLADDEDEAAPADDPSFSEEEPDFIELTVAELAAGMAVAPQEEGAGERAAAPRASAAAPVAEAACAEPAGGGTILGEVINRNVQTLGDTLAVQHDVASELRLAEPVTDLKRAIGINDKFLMIRDLFDGDGAAFDTALDALNACADFDDCMIYIAEHHAWNPDSDGARLLMELLERKYV